MAKLQIHQSRAARGAALFVMAIGTAASVALADVQMRVEKLWLLPSDGRELAIDVEIADDAKQKALGLMFRTELADNKGMLFPYGEPREISMWMRNTYIPLDMLFIKPDGVIHRIEVRTEPLSERIVASGGPVSAVLELAGGATQRLGIKAGDRVRHPSFSSAAPEN